MQSLARRPSGERCVQTQTSNLCQSQAEGGCEQDSDCAAPLLCAVDSECRDSCSTDGDCLSGQVCAVDWCAEPDEVDDSGELIVDAPAGCSAGEECTPDDDPCALGITWCDGATPRCQAVEQAEDGTVCGDGMVCTGGSCVDCSEGESCAPDNPCQDGVLTCGNAPSCVATSNKVAGVACDTNQVCDGAGACVSCEAGSDCVPDNPCRLGTLECAGGPRCDDAGSSLADGTSCGDGGSCVSGSCVSDERTLVIISSLPAAVPINAPFPGVTVELVDGDDVPIAGAVLQVQASPGAYAVASNTDASGTSLVSGRVGRAVGTHTFTVSAQGAAPVEFTVGSVAPSAGQVFTAVNVNHENGEESPGPGTLSKLYYEARAVTSASDGTLYLASWCGVYRLSLAGALTLVAGHAGEGCGFSGDGGPANEALVYNVAGLALDETNQYLYLADNVNARVRQIDISSQRTSAGTIVSYAGGGEADDVPWGDGGPAVQAFVYPSAVAVGPGGDVYISDAHSKSIRRVDFETGVISTAVAQFVNCKANTPQRLFRCGDFDKACGMAWDANGQLYISGEFCGANIGPYAGVARVGPDEVLTIVAGAPGYPNEVGDGGPATAARFMYAPTFALDGAGNLFLGTIHQTNRIRRIDAVTGIITTVMGDKHGSLGDYGPAASAQLRLPGSLAFDGAGNLHFADKLNFAIRTIWQANQIGP